MTADNIVEDSTHIIARPELTMLREMIGLTVPAIDMSSGRPTPRWRLMLRLANGDRLARWLGDVADGIDLADGTRLWLHPRPAPPSLNMVARWSTRSQQDWLKGADPPNVAELFGRLRAVFDDFLDLPSAQSEGMVATLALWVMLTYVFQAWDAVPYLYVGGPASSGKSRTFEVLERLVNRPTSSSNTTASALFRRLHDRGGTLLLDEAERLKEQTPDAGELRSILLAGYKRGGTATRNERTGNGAFEQIEFEVFGPKAVACIAGLPPPLLSRCIRITMFRSPPGSMKPRKRLDADVGRWAALRDDLHRLTLDYGYDILRISRRTEVCPVMSGRNYELWQPLMALAHWLEELGVSGLLNLIQSHAAQVIETSQEDQTPDVDEILLRKLADSVRDLNFLTPKELLMKAKEEDLETFKSMTPRHVSNILKRYGVNSVRSNGRRIFRADPADIQRIESSYGLDLGFAKDA